MNAGGTGGGGSAETLIRAIREGVIGDGAALDGPFGVRRLVYADYTASGRALTFVEDVIRDRVLPLYGNTHTEASATGRQTTALREQARAVIHRSVGGSARDAVLFCGSGSTAAVDKLVRILGLGTGRRQPARHRPVVFVGPYEHHSNELPWRESAADVVVIGETADGQVDLAHLEAELRHHARRPLRIGSFSAASNVTGILADVDRVSTLLHRYGALACWDYAAGGPYLPIEMNPASGAGKDAVFLSPHKFVGGPGTPGVLVVKRDLLRGPVPTVPGGGTIVFVSPSRQSYHPDAEVREEGGTPAIVESIRAGLVFALKDAVGAAEIHRREAGFARRATTALRAQPTIRLLGHPDPDRLAILSFGIWHRRGMLHGSFVVAVLNDLFGIQARSGCFCAGPYVHRAFPISDDWSRRMEAQALAGELGAKLSFSRIGFPYFTSEAVFGYVIAAVGFLAVHGWKLLPLYRFDPVSGNWEHRDRPAAATMCLRDMVFGATDRSAAAAQLPERVLPGYLQQAHRLVAALTDRPPPGRLDDPPLSADFERIRWFPLPAEALAELRAGAGQPGHGAGPGPTRDLARLSPAAPPRSALAR